jgi:hypothetical protein
MNSTLDQDEVLQAQQNESDRIVAMQHNKSRQRYFINLVNDEEYINTLDDNSAFIRVNRYKAHRFGNSEKMGISIDLCSPNCNDSIFIQGSDIWDKFLVYGGKAIQRRYYTIAPTQSQIDEAIEQLTSKYIVSNA